MFMGKSTNNNNGVNVNSALYVSFSDTCMLKIGAWNLNLSVKFHPAKGVNSDGLRQYAMDKTEVINTSLTIENTGALITGIKDIINPAINDKKEAKVSVAIGDQNNRKVLSIKTDGSDVFCEIALAVSEQGVADPANVLSHKFNKKSYMVNYDPNTGSGEEVPTNADFINFCKKLEDIYQLTAAVAHSINYNNALKTSFSGKSSFNSNDNNNSYSAPTSTFNSFDDFSLPQY